MNDFTKTVLMKDDYLANLRKLANLVWFKFGKKHVYYYIVPVNMLAVILMIIPMYSLRSSLNNTSKQLVLIVTISQVVYKTIFFSVQYDRIVGLVKTVESKFWDLNSCGQKIRQGIKNEFDRVVTVLLGHIFLGYAGAVGIICFPLIPYPENQRALPLRLWLPDYVDIQADYLWKFIYVFSSANSFITLSAIFSYDLLFVYFAQHLFGQIKMLEHKYKTMCNIRGINEKCIIHSKKYQNIIKRRLQYCSNYHSVLIRFGNDLSRMSSGASFIQLGISTITIVFLAFCVVKEHNFINTLQICSFLYSIIVQFSIYTSYGSELQERSKSLSIAIYESKWHLLNANLQKDVAFAMMNAQKEITLTAAGFVLLTNNTLVQVFKTSFSWVTLMLSLAKT